jgi:hypothetical protein
VHGYNPAFEAEPSQQGVSYNPEYVYTDLPAAPVAPVKKRSVIQRLRIKNKKVRYAVIAAGVPVGLTPVWYAGRWIFTKPHATHEGCRTKRASTEVLLGVGRFMLQPIGCGSTNMLIICVSAAGACVL